MKKVSIVKNIFLFVVVLSIYNTAQAQTNATEIIKNLNENWLHAIQNKDSVALGKILAEDFIMINPSGSTMTKRDNLENTVLKNIVFDTISVDSVKVRFLNKEVAVLSCWASFAFTVNAK